MLVQTISLVLLLVACATPPPSTPEPRPNLMEMEEWDLAVISDSSGWGIGEQLAVYIEEDLGIKVTVHNKAIGALTAVQALEALRSSDPDTPNMNMRGWPEIIREAEFIVLNPSPAESISDAHPGDWDCFGGPNFYVNDCSLETFEQYTEDLEALVAEILSLREGSPTIIRFFTLWCRPRWWQLDGVERECTQCAENMVEAIRQAAGTYGIPVAPVLDTFNGPNHDVDPEALGYIGTDGVHASEEGQRVLADILRDLGYEPINP